MQRLHLAQISWDDLLHNILDILFQDENKLEQSIEYYKKLFNSENPDKVQLEKMYQRLTHEQRRLDYLRELVGRFQSLQILAIASNLDNSLRSETIKKGGKIDKWTFTIYREKDTIKTYFQPLTNV